MRRSWTNGLRWIACFGFALVIHAAGAAALILHWNDQEDFVANAPVITIDLAPVAVAPNVTPTDVPPDQTESKQQIAPEPEPEKLEEIAKTEPEPEPELVKPVEETEINPEPADKPELAILPPPKPPEVDKPVEDKKKVVKKKKKPHRTASLASAPSTAERKANRSAAPAPGSYSDNRNALRNWASRLASQIERHKRYPSDANGATGTAVVSFSVDRSGRALRTRIVRSSGNSVLDRDAIASIQRSQPLPPPPAEQSGSQFPVVVPLRYSSR